MTDKKILSLAAAFAVLLALTGQVTAIGAPQVMVDGAPLESKVEPELYHDSTYAPVADVTRAFYPQAEARWENGAQVIRGKGLELTARPGEYYLICNGRYLYVPDALRTKGGEVTAPLRVLCRALGAQVSWDAATATATIQAGSGPILSGEEYYDSETLYWLSRIIYAESGNQSLAGKIAVGNVVMNRVADPTFPNSVYKVIYQRNQFTPAMTGTVKRTPSAESVIAAKLVLDGANTAGNSLYFVNPKYSPRSWASRNRPYVATIGAHAFFA